MRDNFRVVRYTGSKPAEVSYGTYRERWKAERTAKRVSEKHPDCLVMVEPIQKQESR